MTTTNDALPKLRTEMGRILCGAETREKYGEVWKHAAEIVRRCNDYPALAARLERAMGLLRSIHDGNDAALCDIMDLLAEHEKEMRP